ncbi:MAG TPA: hypothetical protein VJZ04_07580 [Lachnospiraceae bacterium]|nr:hypothetical protein [Lachnospiraceae bacterium]
MESYRKKVIKRNKLLGIVCILFAGAIIVLFKIEDKLPQVEGFIKGFNVGAFTGVEFIFLFYIVRNLIVIADEKKLKKQYIKENDERACLIVQKMGSVGMIVVMIIFLFMTIVSGFLNKVAFFSFLSAIVVVEITMIVLKVYYSKKFSA